MSSSARPSGFHPGPSYLALPKDPQQWVIRDLIPVSGLVNLYGKPKSKKSRLVMGMAEAVANGRPHWLSFEVCKHGPVAVLQLDTPRGEWSGRIQAMEQSGHSTANIHISDMLTSPFPFNALDPAHVLWLKTAMAAIQPVMVIVDTFREAFSGDENSSDTQKQVIGNLVQACRPAAVIVLSHARKDSMFSQGGSDDLMGDNRGSGYLAGRMDCVIRMTPMTMSYQGRSVGRRNVPIDPVEDSSGLLKLGPLGEDDQHLELVRETARRMLAAQPAIGKNALCKQLMAMFQISDSTAARRLDDIAPGHWARKAEPPHESDIAA